MAFLSEATHRALVGKQDLEPFFDRQEHALADPQEAGIQCTGEFIGGVRCMEVHRMPNTKVEDMKIWTGEQDGALCVRDGLGRAQLTLEKKQHVFVTALMCHGTPGRFMYAGMSDGYVRVYDQLELPDGEVGYEMIFEQKKHTSSVTCMLSVRDLIITGGRDWQIFTWKWDGEPGNGGVFRWIDQLWRHQNAVRCLAYGQGPERLLYSGGDDGAIICVELETGRPRTVMGGFPIGNNTATRNGHRASVRALVVYERYLFSASEDGTVKVWDSQDGTFVHTMYRAAHPDAAVLTLLADPTGCRIWAGGSDGVIRVFGAYDHVRVCPAPAPAPTPVPLPHPLPQITQLEDQHAGAMITGLMPTGRVNAIKAWYLSKQEGKLKLLYCESDQAEHKNGVEFFSKNELPLAEEVRRLRDETIKGSKLRDEQVRLHSLISGRAERRRERVLAYIEDAYCQYLKSKFFARLLLWQQMHHANANRLQLLHVLASNSTRFLCAVYYSKLQGYGAMQADHRRRIRVARSLFGSSQRQAQVYYYRQLRLYARNAEKAEHRRNLAHCLACCTDKGLLAVHFSRLAKKRHQMLVKRKRQQIVSCLGSTQGRTLQYTYFHKLWAFVKIIRHRQKVAKTAKALQHLHTLFLRRAYFKKCVTWTRNGKKRLAVRDCVEASAEHRELLEMRRVWGCLRGFFHLKQEERLNVRCEELDDKNDAITLKLQESSAMTDDDIAAEVAELENEMIALNAEMAEIEGDIVEAEKEGADLQSELRAIGRPQFEVLHDSKKKTVEEAAKFVGYLKTYGVNCIADQKTIDTLDNNKEKKGVRPETLFVEGVQKFRDALANECDDQRLAYSMNLKAGTWDFPQDVVQLCKKRTFEAAHAGLKMVVIACDQLHDPKLGAEAQKALERTTAPAQVLKNQNVLVDCVLRVYEERMAKQLVQLGQDKVKELGHWETEFGSVRACDLDWVAGGIRRREKKVKVAEPAPGGEDAAGAPEEATDHGAGSEEDVEEVVATPRRRRSRSAGKKPTAGIKLSPELKILTVTADGPAALAGLQVGDVLLTVNKIPLQGKKSYQDALKKQKLGASVVYTFRRNGRTKNANVALSK